MGRMILSAVLVLLGAGPVGAQISGGPTGPFVLVDNDGKVIGGILGTEVAECETTFSASPFNCSDASLSVALRTGQGSGLVVVAASPSESTSTLEFNRFKSTHHFVFFESWDCTGQAYSAFDPDANDPLLGSLFLPRIEGGPAHLVVEPDSTVYVPAEEPIEAAFYSLKIWDEYENAECLSGGGPDVREAFPLTEVGNLSTEFTPPFHVAVLDDPEWIPAGIPLPEWFGVLMVGFLFGVFYMRRRARGAVAA